MPDDTQTTAARRTPLDLQQETERLSVDRLVVLVRAHVRRYVERPQHIRVTPEQYGGLEALQSTDPDMVYVNRHGALAFAGIPIWCVDPLRVDLPPVPFPKALARPRPRAA